MNVYNETESQTWRTNWWLPVGRVKGRGARQEGIKRYKLLSIK